KNQYAESIKQNDYWLSNLSRSFIDQTDPAWLLAYPEKVKQTTGDQLQQICKQLLGTPNLIAVLQPENYAFKIQIFKKATIGCFFLIGRYCEIIAM
ncbi:MAG: hypothetical protein ACK5PO_05485, partial [Bacteroidota bacterium]